jgi:hypothetical protein
LLEIVSSALLIDVPIDSPRGLAILDDALQHDCSQGVLQMRIGVAQGAQTGSGNAV